MRQRPGLTSSSVQAAQAAAGAADYLSWEPAPNMHPNLHLRSDPMYDHHMPETSGFVVPEVQQTDPGVWVSIAPPLSSQVLPTRFTEASGALPSPVTIGGAASVPAQVTAAGAIAAASS